MSNELESDRAMVMNLESFGVDGVGYDETETEPPSSTVDPGPPPCELSDDVPYAEVTELGQVRSGLLLGRSLGP